MPNEEAREGADQQQGAGRTAGGGTGAGGGAGGAAGGGSAGEGSAGGGSAGAAGGAAGGAADGGAGGGSGDTPKYVPTNWFTSLLAGANWSLIILLGFVMAILGAVLSDNTVLRRLQDPAYARGVITFLVSLAAIALAFMFAYQAFTSTAKESEEGFRRGREVLASLMGVLGTIIGFYFGSTENAAGFMDVALKQEGTRIIVHATGGTAPYRMNIDFKPDTVTDLKDQRLEDEWATFNLPAGVEKVEVEVLDAKDVRATKSIEPKASTTTSADGAAAPSNATTTENSP